MRTAFLLLTLAAIGCSGATTRNPVFEHSEETPKEEEKRVKPSEIQPEATVSASELLDAYEENEIAADRQYKGKVLKVGGWVGQVRSDWVGLNIADNSPPSVVCMVDPAHRDEFAGAKKEMSLHVIGRCRGMEKRTSRHYKGIVIILDACRPAPR